MSEGVGVAVEEGDVVGVPVGCVVGVPVGCGVPVGDAGLVGVVREVGLGVVVGGDVAGAGPAGVEGCTVAGVTPPAAGDGGLTLK